MTPFNVLIMKKLFVEVKSLFFKWDTGIFKFVNSMLVMIKKEKVQLAIEKHLSINYSDEESIKNWDSSKDPVSVKVLVVFLKIKELYEKEMNKKGMGCFITMLTGGMSEKLATEMDNIVFLNKLDR